MNYTIMLSNSLTAAINELKEKNNITCTQYHIHIYPDTSEKELSRLSSKDLYYKTAFIKGKYESKTFTTEETAKIFSPPMGLPLWMEMSLLSHKESEMHIKLKISIRFRKPKDLHNKETSHPPIKVL
ncbi:MAG: hypothetical protein HFI28_07635 [Lachnospiraceae bacterium]|jgi:hypothetical protein|nr:hypothetical protein [Lachnospiraceae bacterium]